MNIELLKKEILDHVTGKEPYFIALDGRCASGKSTLASALSKELNAPVLHMDDFFLQKSQRTKERYQTPGGNVDYERVKTVFDTLCQKKDVFFQKLDCKTFELGEEKCIPYHPLILVEGSYSCHPSLVEYYSYKLFLTVNPDIQKERLSKRNAHNYQDFIEKWIPYEELYFEAYDVMHQCDKVIDTSQMSL